MTRADLNKQPLDVSSMFDTVAKRYDLLNAVLALGQDRSWRQNMVSALRLESVENPLVLDVAAGTGTSSAAIAKSGYRVIASDFSAGMMQEGIKRQPQIPFVGADATKLPFKDNIFDAAVVSFGLRNVNQPKQALAQMKRVVKPGGTVVVCEFSTPTNPLFRNIYKNYLLKALPKIAAKTASNPQAYSYLAESILDWPNQEQLLDWFIETGFKQVQYRNLTFGIVALHRAIVP